MVGIAKESPEALAEQFLNDPCGLDDPQALLAQIREDAPIFPGPHGVYIVSGYEEAQAVYRDQRFGSQAGMAREIEWYRQHARNDEEAGVAEAVISYQMMTLDEPDHSRLRAVVRDAFTLKAVERWRPMIDRHVSELIDSVKDLESFDAVHMLGYPLSEHVICEILGVPFADHESWEVWSRVIGEFNRTRPPAAEEVHALLDAAVSFMRYFTDLIEKRREHSGDDLVSVLLAANTDNAVSQDELVGMMQLIITAGHGTTANMVVNGLYSLLRHPEEYRKLRGDPSLIPSAVDEMLRYEPSAPFPFPRCPLEESEVSGVSIPPGSAVLVADHAANRDPRIFPEPDRFNVERFVERTSQPHLSFGFGIHRCLGHFLARAELESIFHAIVTELPELELIEVGEWHHGFFRHLDSLVVGPKN